MFLGILGASVIDDLSLCHENNVVEECEDFAAGLVDRGYDIMAEYAEILDIGDYVDWVLGVKSGSRLVKVQQFRFRQ